MNLLKVIFFYLFILANICFAQKPAASSYLDTNTIKIGEQVSLTLQVDFVDDGTFEKITWPTLKDTVVTKVEIVGKSAIDTTQPEGNDGKVIRLMQVVSITCFDSGYYAIPPFKFLLSSDPNDYVESQPLLLTVLSVEVDTTKDIKDIKLPYEAPFNFRESLPYVFGGILLAIIIYVLYRYYKGRTKKGDAPVVPVVKIPADAEALKRLNETRESKLWESGKYKQFYSEISDTIRWYIEQRFKVPALEQTTDEILTTLRTGLNHDQKLQLRQILILSDLVKFAKEQPLATENEQTIHSAIEFVKSTAPQQKEGGNDA